MTALSIENLPSLTSLIDNFETDPISVNELAIDSRYFQPPEYIQNNTDKLNILNLNIRSLACNYDNLIALLNSCGDNFHIITLNETWVTPLSEDCFDIQNFKTYHVHRTNAKCGGVSIYVKNNIPSTKIDEMSLISNHIEACAVSIKVRNQDIAVLSVYRPPNSHKNDFINHIDHMLNGYLKDKNVIIAGDFNIDLLKINSNNDSSELFSTMIGNKLFPCINRATRPNPDMLQNSSLIDQIWTNLKFPVNSGILLADISDHLPICSSFLISPPEIVYKDLKFRPNKELNDSIFATEINKINFNFIHEDSLNINEKYESFTRSLMTAYDISHPIINKKVSTKRLDNPWLTKELLSLIDRKHRLFSSVKKGIIPNHIYTHYRNKLDYIIKKEKAKYYSKKISECEGDAKKHWNLIKNTINKKTPEQNNIKKLIVDDEIHTQPEDIANGMNKYFAGVGKNLADKIAPSPIPFSHYMGERLDTKFSFTPITSTDVISVIKGLKNKNCNTDCIPNRLYKLIDKTIAPHLASLYNQSLNDGIYPQSLKIAKITPIHKAGDPSIASNYRPISILPTMGKILEKIVFDQLSNYLRINNVLSPTQFGFRVGNTTNDAISTFLELIYKNLNDKKSSIVTYLDFSKAFDTVDHKILIAKLSHYGIRDVALKWFISYIEHRGHSIKIENFTSSIRETQCGVPQGSILGPILFVLYINDFSKCHISADSFFYADDTTVVTSDENVEALCEKTNAELQNIYYWLNANKLSLNVAKSVFMMITNKQNQQTPILKINNIPLTNVKEAKVLGVIIDNKLTFKSHIEHVTRKISKITYLIYRLKSYVPLKVIKTLYYSLAYPHLIYNIITWGSASKIATQSLIVQHKRLIRLLSNSNEYLEHTNPIFKKLQLLKLCDIYKLNIGMYMFKIINGIAPELITREVNSNQILHNHATRQAPDFIHKPQYTIEKSRNALTYKGPNIWNNLPSYIRHSPTPVIFKNRLKKHLLSAY